jgi:hypothetical protein
VRSQQSRCQSGRTGQREEIVGGVFHAKCSD